MYFKTDLFSRWFPRIISVIFALGLWYYIQRMKQTERVLRVRLAVKNRPSFLVPVNKIPETVKIKISGLNRKLLVVDKRQIRAIIDMSTAVKGQNFFKIHIIHKGFMEGVKVSSFSKNIKVKLDFLREKMIPIRPRILNNPAVGFEIKQYRIDPKTLLIEGPFSVIKNIKVLYTFPVNISGIRNSMRRDVYLDIEGLNIKLRNKTQITLFIRIEKSEVNKDFREFALIPVSIIGIPKLFKLENKTNLFTSVRISGSKKNLKTINPLIIGPFIDLSKVKEKGKYRFKILTKPLKNIDIIKINPEYFDLIIK